MTVPSKTSGTELSGNRVVQVPTFPPVLLLLLTHAHRPHPWFSVAQKRRQRGQH